MKVTIFGATGALGRECLDPCLETRHASTLVLSFLPEKEGGRIELVQVDVVDAEFAGVRHGWEKFHGSPWRAHLTRPDGRQSA
jgi:hypothetical protein